MKKLAIVGAEPHTRDNAPWDDKSFDIWLVNEWPLADWAKRYTASVDIHWEEVFSDPKYDRGDGEQKGYYDWLKKVRGKPVYMQKYYPDIPDSVAFPLDETRALVSKVTYNGKPIKNFRSSISYCTALAIYQGYEQIDYYGIELAGTEYKGQMSNFNFWAGVAAGKGIIINLHCSKTSFVAPLYGYEAFMKNSRADQYLLAMQTQLAEERQKVNMLEGAVQLATQMLEDEQKDDVDVLD